MRGAVLPASRRLRRLWRAVLVSVVALEQLGTIALFVVRFGSALAARSTGR